MNQFTYENQSTCTYLVYKVDDEIIDTMTLGMITNNHIPGLAKPLYSELNGGKYLKYNITAKLPLSKLFMGSVTKQQILNIFLGIIIGVEQLDNYIIDVNSILFDLNYIYTDASISEVMLICIPEINDTTTIELKDFFKKIIVSLNFEPGENGDYIAKILAYLNSAQKFDLANFKQLLEQLQKNNVQVQRQTNVGYTVPGNAQNYYYQQEYTMNTPVNNSNAFRVEGPNIQNVYVGSPKADKIAKREEQKKREQEENVAFKQPMIGDINANIGFAVPGSSQNGGTQAVEFAYNNEISAQNNKKTNKKKKTGVKPNVADTSEDDISLGYLLQHYSKENAQKYKAAKERKRQQKSSQTVQQETHNMSTAQAQGMIKNVQMQQQMMAQNPQMQQQMMVQNPQMQQQMMAQNPQMQQQMMAQNPQMQQQMMAQNPQMQQQMMAQNPQMQQPIIAQNTDMQALEFSNSTSANSYDDAQTSVLGVTPVNKKFYLYRCRNGQKIYINKAAIRIGKSHEIVDACISDNSAISRCHAIIYNDLDKCSIEDMNSTNGTYVDDNKIIGNTKVDLRVGTRIKLADEEFELRYE